MNEKEILGFEKYRGEIYWALSRCYSPPEKSIGDVLKILEAGLCATGSQAISQAVMMRSELKRGVTVENLDVQFAKLFIGPYYLLAPPFGSIYLDNKRQIMGDSTLDVAKRYLAAKAQGSIRKLVVGVIVHPQVPLVLRCFDTHAGLVPIRGMIGLDFQKSTAAGSIVDNVNHLLRGGGTDSQFFASRIDRHERGTGTFPDIDVISRLHVEVIGRFNYQVGSSLIYD